MNGRIAQIGKKTKEVDIRGRLNLDGSGRGKVKTGIGLLDHMLELLAKHGLLDLELKAKGDLHIDLHHTNEDLGLALGEAFKKALGDKKGIHRMGSCYVPMDESLARTVVDLCGRAYFRWGWASGFDGDGAFRQIQEAGRTPYGVEEAKHFLESFSAKAEATIHVDVEKAGKDLHHLLEAVFKGLGRALRDAAQIDPKVKGIPSTKGKL